jgi:hypothetical protein
MTDQPTVPDPPLPGPADYIAAAREQGQVPFQAAAAQAVADVVQDSAETGTDAGAVLDKVREQVTREVLVPMETKIDAMMKAAQAQQDTLMAQIKMLQGQLTATQAKVGPPAVQLYATSAAQRVRSIAAANPNLGQNHFAGVIEQADQLAVAAKDVAAGKADPGELGKLAAPVERFFASHPSFIEGGGTLVSELGHLADEAAKIAVAA